MDALDQQELTARLTELPGWVADDGTIAARYDAPDVPTATQLITEVMEAAEVANHHPDVDLRWKRVLFRLVTHDAGNVVTAQDTDLAAQIVMIAQRLGAEPMNDLG